METKDLIIYNGVCRAAEHVFNNVICPVGTYAAKDLAKNLLVKFFYQENFWNNEINNIFSVEFDGYKCTFPAGSAFEICAQIETAWNIPSARRIKFNRKADAAPVAVSFDVPAAAKEIIKIIPAKEDFLRPSRNYVLIDTRRRALITYAENVLTAVAVPDMYVSEDARENYLISPALLKTGKGTVIIDKSGNGANGQISAPAAEENIIFPNWQSIFPAVQDAQRISLGNDLFKQLKKEILAAGKFADAAPAAVQICAAADSNKLVIRGMHNFDAQTREIELTLPQPAPFEFAVSINGKQFAAVPAADSIYLYRHNITDLYKIVFVAAGAVSICSGVDINNRDNFINIPAFAEDAPENKQLTAVAAFPAEDAPNSAAAVASVQDEETAAPAADSWENSLPRAVVCFNDINLFAEDQRARLDEIRNAAPAAEDAPAVAVQDEEETAAPVAVAAEDETRPAFEDAAAAFADEMPEYFNNLNLDEEEKARAAFAAAFADEETARAAAEDEETAPAVQDEEEETAPAAEFVPADRLKIWGVSPAVQDLANYSPAVAAQMKIQNNVFTYNSILPGLIMIHKHDNNLFVIILDATNKGYKTKELYIYPNSRKRAKLITKFYYKLDIQPGGKSLFDVCPAAEIGKVLNILAVQDKDIFNLAAPVQDAAPAADPVAAEDAPETAANVPAVSLPAAELETAPAVQDEETAAPAVSLPVPVSAVSVWYAVYHFGKLENVYFSKLLADEIVINSLFVAGETKDLLAVPSPSAAPAEFPRQTCPLFAAVAAVQDEETAPAVQDEETAAPADSVPAFASVFAIMPEIWETAAPAAEDETAAPADSVPFLDEETNGAPFAAEDAPAVAAFYLAANFARRARRVFSFAAALLSLLLITAAPRFIASVAVQETAPAVQDAQPAPAFNLDEETAPAVAADSVPAAELRNSPETAPAVAADSLPADRMKQPRNARKRARRVNPDNLAPAVAVSLPVAADSVPADSVPADSVPFLETAAPADSVPAARSVAADSVQTAAPAEDAPAVQDAAPAAEDETAAPAAEDEETAPAVPADSVPAEDAPAPANSPAPAVPVSSVAVPGCPGVPAALLLILML